MSRDTPAPRSASAPSMPSTSTRSSASPCRRGIGAAPRSVSTRAPGREAAVAEITGLLPPTALAGCPPRTRVIVRRERPHPSARLDAIEERGGYRYTALAIDTRIDQHARLHAHHRGRPRRGPHSPAATPDGWRPTKPVPT
jgi:hypothetical protein